MLPFQVGAIDFNRPGAADTKSDERAVRVNRPYLRWIVPVLSFLALSMISSTDNALADNQKGKRKRPPAATASASAGEESLTNIPLAIGHEAKGLVLPDFDLEGHLRGKFEAGIARRLDQEHVEFSRLKITTFTDANQPDLTIEMNDSIFDLKTRILSSKERTTIRRADFNIAGDTVQFDTASRTGKLIGNVKMELSDHSRLKPQTTE
jgi:hypothetical protein